MANFNKKCPSCDSELEDIKEAPPKICPKCGVNLTLKNNYD